MSKMKQFTEDLKEAIKKWNEGSAVWTAELGGIGPGYEQAIQILFFEIMSRWGDNPLPESTEGSYPIEFTNHVNEVVNDLDETCFGFSGAQVGAAKSAAWRFMSYGYSNMMNELGDSRRILVSRRCPSLE